MHGLVNLVRWKLLRSECLHILFSHKLTAKALNQSASRCHSSVMLTPDNCTSELTIKDVSRQLDQLIGVSGGYVPNRVAEDRSALLPLLPTSQEELPARSMQDSYTTAIVPLATDTRMQERYVSFLGHVRLGRLMEDMDIFAAYVVYKHILNPKQSCEDRSPYSVVTLLVDQIDFADQFTPSYNEDIRLMGHVTCVGKTSVECIVLLEQNAGGEWKCVTRATLLMAARNSTQTGAAFVNPLVAKTDREREILREGEDRKRGRLARRQNSLEVKGPDPEEQQLIHELFKQTVNLDDPYYSKRTLPPGTAWMGETRLNTTLLCHPQHKNYNNTVFGGFLMRQALELAWTTGYFIGKHRPKLRYISNVMFKEPVAIGSFLRMSSEVVYTEGHYMQVVIYVEVYDQVNSRYKLTNSLNYTLQLPETAVKVLPATYLEAMKYLDGRRHFLEAMKQ